MKKDNLKNYLFLILFICTLCLPIIFINRTPDKISPSENRFLTNFPDIFNQNGNLNHGLRNSLQNWLNDNIGFRDKLINIHAWVDYNVFKISPSPSVEKGKDGWFFYTKESNMDIPKGTYKMTPDMLVKIKENQEAWTRYYKKQGIDYVLVINPSKASVYPEYINSGNYKVGNTVANTVLNYLKQISNVKVMTTKDALLQAKQKGTVFFKTDTHWNLEGAYTGYCSVINNLCSWGLITSKPIKVNLVPSTQKCEFSAMMGYDKLLPEEHINATEIINPKAKLINEGKLFDQINNKKAKYNNKKVSWIYTNPSAEKKSVLVYGDSMFAFWNIPQLFAETFSNYTYVWSYNMNQNYTEIVKPDIVIMDIGERYLASLPSLTCDLD